MRPSTLLSFPFLSFPFHLIIHTEMTSLSRSSGAPAQASLYSPRHHTLSLFLYYIYTPLLFTYMYTLATSLAYIHIYTPSPKPPLLSFLLLPLETRSGGAVRSSSPIRRDPPARATPDSLPPGASGRRPAGPRVGLRPPFSFGSFAPRYVSPPRAALRDSGMACASGPG